MAAVVNRATTSDLLGKKPSIAGIAAINSLAVSNRRGASGPLESVASSELGSVESDLAGYTGTAVVDR
ncbi:hypothetical protein ACFWFQ_12880 [Nocardia salmonicida]|uniref:hypothetical protein n=1 Tax=Nocardia salmonicida TaxID=53431 RepID=UPI0036536818